LWLDLGEYRGPGRFHVFVRFAISRAKERRDTLIYRAYVADSLRLVPQGQYLNARFVDSILPAEDFDADEIADRFAKKLGAKK
jgi:hypothetical protein